MEQIPKPKIVKNVKIIAANNINDFEKIAEDLRQVYNEAFSRAPWFEPPLSQEKFQTYFKELIRDRESILRIAQDENNKIIGGKIDGPLRYKKEVRDQVLKIVDPRVYGDIDSAQNYYGYDTFTRNGGDNQGVGSFLIDSQDRFLADKGVQNIFRTTNAESEALQSFFQKLGHIVYSQPFPNGVTPAPRVLLQKILSQK